LFAIRAYPRLAVAQGFDFLLPANNFGKSFAVYFALAAAAGAIWQFRFSRIANNKNEKIFHVLTGTGLSLCALLLLFVHLLDFPFPPVGTAFATALLEFLPILLFAALIYAVQKYNFLQIGRQTNLIYAVTVTFLALLYLALVRRVSGLLEPVLPPEATASILLFVLVIFVEPIQRILARRLRQTAEREAHNIRARHRPAGARRRAGLDLVVCEHFVCDDRDAARCAQRGETVELVA